MKKFIDLKMFFIASILFSFLHWFIYPLFPASYNKYILDGIVMIVAALVIVYQEKKAGNKDGAEK